MKEFLQNLISSKKDELENLKKRIAVLAVLFLRKILKS